MRKTAASRTSLRRFTLEPEAQSRQIEGGGDLQRATERLSYRPYITTRELPLIRAVAFFKRRPPDFSGQWG